MTRLLLWFGALTGGFCVLLAGVAVTVGALIPRDHIAVSLDAGTIYSQILLVDLRQNRTFPLLRQTATLRGFGSLAWSPDGRTLAFSALDTSSNERAIFTLDLPAMRLNRQADFGASPVWSPDGGRIAFPARLPTSTAILVVERDASPAAWDLLASFDLISEIGGLDWSPDGRTILFSTRNAALLRLDLGSGRSVTLASDRAAHPRYAPDGQRIAYLQMAGFGEWALVVADPNARDITPLTEDGFVRATHAAAWSPDGARIAFASTGGNLYSVDADGRNLRLLLPVSVIERSLGIDWRPR